MIQLAMTYCENDRWCVSLEQDDETKLVFFDTKAEAANTMLEILQTAKEIRESDGER